MRKILVIDDDPNIRFVFGMALNTKKTEAFAIPSEYKFLSNPKFWENTDCAVIGWDMAPIPGSAVLRHIASRYPRIPVIVLCPHFCVGPPFNNVHYIPKDTVSSKNLLGKINFVLESQVA